MLRSLSSLLVFLLGVCWISSAHAGFTLSQNDFKVVVAPGFDHAPILVPVVLDGGTQLTDIQIASDNQSLIPSYHPEGGGIQIEFNTRSLLNGSVATLTLSHDGQATEVFVTLQLSPLEVYRLLEDPSRAVVYGIHQVGIEAGAIFVYNPAQNAKGRCLTVGKKPTDFVISADGTELLVICSVDKSISVIDLATFTLTEIIPLPVYAAWGSAADTSANIDIGPGNILYYVDGAWGPTMHVFDRSTRTVLQSIQFTGGTPSNTTGFMDFAVSSDFSRMVAMPQYGWSAGAHSSILAHYSIASDGRLTYLASSTVNTGLAREPFEAPVLITADDDTVFLKTISVAADNINSIQRTYPSAVWSISPYGEWAATATGIYDTVNGNLLASIPAATAQVTGYLGRKAQVFTSNYQSFVYFDPSVRDLKVLDTLPLFVESLGGSITPLPGALLTQVDELAWTPYSGIARYDVYLGTSEASVSSATRGSPEFLGTVEGDRIALTTPPAPGATYYWRIDPVVDDIPQQGPVFDFTVSLAIPGVPLLEQSMLAGQPAVTLPLEISTASPDTAWSLAVTSPGISIAPSSGTGSATIQVTLDLGNLPVGNHVSLIAITSASGTVNVPVSVTVSTPHYTVLKSDRDSSLVYAISENTAVVGSPAYLVEIDSATEQILRVAPVGTSATDLTLHAADNRIYVTNWRGGHLLAVNRTTFQIDRTYAFEPFGSVGYADGDAFRVSAGAAGRLVVEPADQWVDISIFDTVTGTPKGSAAVREGGGVHDSTGRFYYHGENNSSGAKIIRYDTLGDVFTQTASIRPAGISSYYGSRTVVLSEDNSRLFWAGVMLDASLTQLWPIGELIYSTSPNGRLAFSQTKIYDTSRQLHILGMPASSTVSAYNSHSKKLVVGTGAGLQFHALELPVASLVAPTLTHASVAGTTVTLNWQDHTLETGFEIQARIEGQETWSLINSALPQNSVSYAVTNRAQGMTHEFRIRAKATEISSPWSEVLSVYVPPLPPSTPSLAITSVQATSISLSWSTGSVYQTAEIERSTGSSTGPWTPLATVAHPSITFTDTTVSPSTLYYYRVRLHNGDLTSAYATRPVTTSSLPAPTTPNNLFATTQSSTEIALSWSDSANEAGYRVQRQVGESDWVTVAELPANSTAYQDTGLVTGTYYNYRVTSFNSVGQATSSTVTQLAAMIGVLVADSFDIGLNPAAWSSLSGSSVLTGQVGLLEGGALWFGSQGDRSATTITLDVRYGGTLSFAFRAGNMTRDGSTYWDNSEAGESVVLEYSTTPGVWHTITVLGTTFPTHSDWVLHDIGLPTAAHGPATSFRWRQLANSGASFDTWALDKVSVKGILPPPPAAPSFINTSANSSRSVAIFWGTVLGAIDYLIERRTPSTDWITVGEAGSDAMFTDHTAQPATAYSYRVKARNSGGSSTPSNHAFVTTWSVLQEWRFQNYGTIFDSDEAADLEDSGTGLPNLLRYAFNMAKDDRYLTVAEGAENKGLPFVRIEESGLHIAFVRRRDQAQSGIHYHAEFSDNLSTWQEAGVEVVAEPISEEFEYVVVRDNRDNTDGPPRVRFARVRISR